MKKITEIKNMLSLQESLSIKQLVELRGGSLPEDDKRRQRPGGGTTTTTLS